MDDRTQLSLPPFSPFPFVYSTSLAPLKRQDTPRRQKARTGRDTSPKSRAMRPSRRPIRSLASRTAVHSAQKEGRRKKIATTQQQGQEGQQQGQGVKVSQLRLSVGLSTPSITWHSSVSPVLLGANATGQQRSPISIQNIFPLSSTDSNPPQKTAATRARRTHNKETNTRHGRGGGRKDEHEDQKARCDLTQGKGRQLCVAGLYPGRQTLEGLESERLHGLPHLWQDLLHLGHQHTRRPLSQGRRRTRKARQDKDRPSKKVSTSTCSVFLLSSTRSTLSLRQHRQHRSASIPNKTTNPTESNNKQIHNSNNNIDNNIDDECQLC